VTELTRDGGAKTGKVTGATVKDVQTGDDDDDVYLE
jgi:hypothetical protein